MAAFKPGSGTETSTAETDSGAMAIIAKTSGQTAILVFTLPHPYPLFLKNCYRVSQTGARLHAVSASKAVEHWSGAARRPLSFSSSFAFLPRGNQLNQEREDLFPR